MQNTKPVAVLEQFQQEGKRITYMIEFLGHRDYWGPLPEAIALFKIYDKRRRTVWERIFDFGKYKRMLSRRLIASQIHPQC